MAEQDDPSQEQRNPYIPGQVPLVMEEFGGIDTNTSRYGVRADKMAWCDGWIPLAPKKLRTMPDIGTVLVSAADLAANTQIRFFYFANIGASPICVIFLSDGSIWQITTDTKVITNIAPAGTILDPSITTVGVSQWGSQFVVIVATQTNGYWIWDGAFLYTAGTVGPNPVVINNGSGYTLAPSVFPYGGSGTGASFSAVYQNGMIIGVSIQNPGSGYLVTDQVGLSISNDGGNTGHTAVIVPTVKFGTISSVSIVNGGAGYQQSSEDVGPSAILTVVGGGGSGGSVAATSISGAGAINGTSIVAGGKGYLASPTILVNDPNSTIAQATVGMAPFGVSGNAVETYQSRVWVLNGANYTWTAAGSTTDFATSDGGGVATSNDSFLRVGYTAAKQAAGVLYLIGDSSINYISGVTTTGNPPTTTFTNQNANPQVGTPYPATVNIWNNAIVFANSFGAHLNSGSSPVKISEELDGVYSTVLNFGGLQLSAAEAVIYGKKVYIILVPIIDPVTNAQENEMFLWDGRKWWASGQSVSLNYIANQEINSVLTAYGTDGDNIYPLFQTASSAFTKTVQSKFWSIPGGYQLTKTLNRFWSLIDFKKSAIISVNVTIENELTQAHYTLNSPNQTILTKNASSVTIPVKNASSVTIPVISTFAGHWVTPPLAVGQQGVTLGFTLDTNEADITLLSAMVAPEIQSYRG